MKGLAEREGSFPTRRSAIPITYSRTPARNVMQGDLIRQLGDTVRDTGFLVRDSPQNSGNPSKIGHFSEAGPWPVSGGCPGVGCAEAATDFRL